jgi:exodeoxyribonuclease-1
MSYVFYDTETTGTNSAFDQILQLAAIRTDADLNELERFEIRCRLLPHIVPAPGAMQVTGISVEQLVNAGLPSHYSMVRAICEKMLSWAPATFLGYNSLTFDEHLLRQALYQTLHVPYLTNTNGNCRSDVYRVVQAATLFAPNALVIPKGESGKQSLKLEHLAPANGFDHANAHDALGDVEATIHICKLLIQRAPELWSNCMRFAQKAAVIELVTDESMFCFADFAFGRSYAGIVTRIGSSEDIPSNFLVYDLATNPDELATLSDADFAKRLRKSPKTVRRLKANSCPVIMPVDNAPVAARALQLGMAELERRVQVLRDNDDLCSRICACDEATRETREPSDYVEEQIYDGFTSDADKLHLTAFHASPWDQRLAVLAKLADQRLQRLGKRLIYFERPECLNEQDRHEIALEFARRASSTDDVAPWMTFNKAIESADLIIAASEGEEAVRLQLHRSFLMSRRDEAAKLLS